MSAWERVAQIVLLGFNLLLFAAVPVFLFDRSVAVFLMLAAVVGSFVTYLTIAVVGYRETMRRPWPKVPPVEGRDDDCEAGRLRKGGGGPISALCVG